MNNLDFVSVLSSALTPVTLISGVGLLMLTMSARYAHTTNRIRELLKTRQQLLAAGRMQKDDLTLIDEEILLIFHRSKLLKHSILFVVISAAFSGLLVLTSVIATVFGINLSGSEVVAEELRLSTGKLWITGARQRVKGGDAP